MRLAKRNNAEIISKKFEDFSKQREAGLREAKSDWIIYIDADERVTPELKKEIEEVILGNDSKDAYVIKRRNFYFGNHEWLYFEKIVRLFRKESLKGWSGKIHESPVYVGKVGELKSFLNHYTHRDLTSMLNKTIVWSDTEAEIRFNANHPRMSWWRFPRVMITSFLTYFIKQKGYKAGNCGAYRKYISIIQYFYYICEAVGNAK